MKADEILNKVIEIKALEEAEKRLSYVRKSFWHKKWGLLEKTDLTRYASKARRTKHQKSIDRWYDALAKQMDVEIRKFKKENKEKKKLLYD